MYRLRVDRHADQCGVVRNREAPAGGILEGGAEEALAAHQEHGAAGERPCGGRRVPQDHRQPVARRRGVDGGPPRAADLGRTGDVAHRVRARVAPADARHPWTGEHVGGARRRLFVVVTGRADVDATALEADRTPELVVSLAVGGGDLHVLRPALLRASEDVDRAGPEAGIPVTEGALHGPVPAQVDGGSEEMTVFGIPGDELLLLLPAQVGVHEQIGRARVEHRRGRVLGTDQRALAVERDRGAELLDGRSVDRDQLGRLTPAHTVALEDIGGAGLYGDLIP